MPIFSADQVRGLLDALAGVDEYEAVPEAPVRGVAKASAAGLERQAKVDAILAEQEQRGAERRVCVRRSEVSDIETDVPGSTHQ